MHVRNSETADTMQLWPPHCDTNSDKVMKIVAMIPGRKHNQIHSHIKFLLPQWQDVGVQFSTQAVPWL